MTKSKQSYTAKFVYEDDVVTVGTISVKIPAISAFNAAITDVLSNTNPEDVLGKDCVRDAAADTYSCTLKCMDANGEMYYVSFTRDHVRLSSYTDDAIRQNGKTRADTVSALALF